MPIEIDVILGVLFLFSLLWAIVMGMANAEKILDRLSDHREGTGEKNKSGMKKIEELKNRLGNLAMTDDRPAVWRICRSLVESLDAIENEHFTEMEDFSHANTVLKAELDKANSVINEQMSKMQKADDEIKKLNARDDDRVSTIKGYQKDLERLSFISAEKEKTIKEIEYERDARGKAIDTLRKQLADAQGQVRAMSALANSAMGEAQTYRWRTAEPLFPAFGVETHIDGATVTIGRDADGKLQQYGDPIVTIQMPHDVYTEQKAKFESQAKELAEAKEQLEFARGVARLSGLKIYEVHGWRGDSLWKIYRYAKSEEALYEQLRRDGYYRIDYTQKIEEVV